MKSFVQSIWESKTEADAISEEDLDQMVEGLTWDDIADLYDSDELIEIDEAEEEIQEALSAAARLRKRMTFARHKAKRVQLRGIKLRRASDFATLKKRATNAARRSITKRLLRGRDKASLSPAEKDRIEQQVRRMKNIQNILAQRMIPKIKKIEQGRLYKKRK
jgi:hypothetical protein